AFKEFVDHSADATLVGLNNGGVCAYPPEYYENRVAVGRDMHDHYVDMCGACLEVTPENRSTVAHVTDICYECSDFQIILNDAAYKALNVCENRPIKVTWRKVNCSELSPCMDIESHYSTEMLAVFK
ncbi:hypothetical protein L0F63_002017, partial [Massospora cicadina]